MLSNMIKKRIAVAILFFMNGLIYANWVARLPEIQSLFDLSNAMLGTVLLCHAAGALVAMPFAGLFINRFGSKGVSGMTAVFFCVIFPLIPLINSLGIVMSVFFMMGICGGAMDVAINGQAVFVERMYDKPIMSSFHAVFSGAMGLGANIGAIFAKAGTPLFQHFILIAIFCFLITLWAFANIIDDKNQNIADDDAVQEKQPAFRLPSAAILPLGIIAFCGMTGEGTMADWSANYLNKIVGVDEGFAALGVASFAWAMFIGRLVGDYVVRVFGKRNILIFSCLVAVLGLSVALSVINAYVALAGFFLVGLALSNVVPIIYSTAGNTEGVAPSVGIAMATTIGYAGFFVGPPIIGYLSDLFNLRIGLLFTLFLFIIMFFLVNRFIKK